MIIATETSEPFVTNMELQSRPEYIRRYVLGGMNNSFTFNLAGKQKQK